MYVRIVIFVIAMIVVILHVVFGVDFGKYAWLFEIVGSWLLRLIFLLVLISCVIGITSLARNLIRPKEGEARKPSGLCGIIALLILSYFLFVGTFLDY